MTDCGIATTKLCSYRADWRWLHQYNWHRPHAGIKGCTSIGRSGADVNNLMRRHG
jgi:hypothetical protein